MRRIQEARRNQSRPLYSQTQLIDHFFPDEDLSRDAIRRHNRNMERDSRQREQVPLGDRTRRANTPIDSFIQRLGTSAASQEERAYSPSASRREDPPSVSAGTSLPSFTEGFARFAITPPPMQPIPNPVPPPIPRASSPDGFRYSADGLKRNGVYDPAWTRRTGRTPSPQ